MSMNVKKRIRQHFNGKMASERRQAFLKDIANIDVCETATELLAALLEDREIRTHRPKYNRAQKHKIKTFALTRYSDRNNYIRLTLTEHKGLEPAIKTFNSLAEGRDWLLTWARTHHIPLALCGIDLGSSPLPPADESNAALLEALAEFDQPEAKVILFVGDGRNYCETSVVATQGDRLLGYAFVPNDVGIRSIDDLDHYLEPLPHSELSSALLRRYAAGLRMKELIHPAV
jgi:DNA polymerase-3 subunit epsilon